MTEEGDKKPAEAGSGWQVVRRNPLLGDLIRELPLHRRPVSFMDGEMLCLFPEGFGQNKVLTYRGGVVVAERELLPPERRAADADLKPAIGAHTGLECGRICCWDKIIRRHWDRWFGLRA